MTKLTSINLKNKSIHISDEYPDFEFQHWVEEIDNWLNENCIPGTFFATRFMRFNFQKEADAIAFKLMFGGQ